MAVVRSSQIGIAEYSAFNHILHSTGANKQGSFFGMFTCFFDESGGEDHGFITVCGYVAPVEAWEKFEAQWKEMLALHKVPYLHMKEYAHFKGPYAKWRNDAVARAQFLKDAASIIGGIVNRGFLCRVSYTDFEVVNQQYYLQETAYSPYALAGRFCIAQANLWVRKSGASLREIDYVFEAGGPDAPGLVASTQKTKLHIPSFRPSRDTENEAAVVQLQAADYFAYEVRKAIVDHPDIYTPPDIFRKSFQAIFDVEVDQGNYGVAELMELCADFSIPKRF
jgi:hypothetical protein